MRTIEFPMNHHSSTVAFLIILAAIIVMSVITSCSGCSQSGRRTQGQSIPEKVVILDSKYSNFDGTPWIFYKVKRINLGVVDQIGIVASARQIQYEVGDTIFYTFNKK